MAQWIVENSYKEYNYQNFIDALDRLGIDYYLVKCIPFCDKLFPIDFNYEDVTIEEDHEGLSFDDGMHTVGFGTIPFLKIIHGQYSPGIFINDNFDFTVWSQEYGELCLNADSIVCKMKDVPKEIPQEWIDDGDVFIRSIKDDKLISGKLYNIRSLFEMCLNIEDSVDHTQLNGNTMVLLSRNKRIGFEYRFFIVDGKPVTASLYKTPHGVIYENIDNGYDELWDFVNQCVELWKPHDCFVLDVCTTSEGLRIVEINNMNTAGFYDTDPYKLIMALEDYLNENNGSKSQ